MLLRLFSSVFGIAWAIVWSTAAFAQSPPSECLAIANNLQDGARVHFAALKPDEAKITYVGHSTFVIESPQGVRAATDFAGDAGDIVPDIVTMNIAHSSHNTPYPDPAIKYPLKGWAEDGNPRARHDLQYRDMRVRNVTTDIRNDVTTRITDGNSIFIFETAGLCIGHLGHLHQELSPQHVGWIGRLDVVMVPVDGGMTLPVANMMEVLKTLRVRVILPMHARFAGSLERFAATAATQFKVEHLNENTITVSAARLPDQPTVFIMPAM
jgi:L-ascorbate metabolism protein UlaG (beta-lactamase superfamily)